MHVGILFCHHFSFDLIPCYIERNIQILIEQFEIGYMQIGLDGIFRALNAMFIIDLQYCFNGNNCLPTDAR